MFPRISDVAKDEPTGSVTLTSPTSMDLTDGTVSETVGDNVAGFSVLSLGRAEVAAVDATLLGRGFALGRNRPPGRAANENRNQLPIS